MKGISAGVILSAITALFAVAAEGPGKAEDSVARDLQSYFNSLVAENQLSGAVLVAKKGVTLASKATRPIIKGIRQRIPAK